VLVDTAGLRDGRDVVERIGIERAESEVKRADILLWLGEADDAPEHPHLVRIHARVDESGRGLLPLGSIATSAVTGQGFDQLTRLLIEQAESILPGEDELALNQRQAAELTSVFAALQQAACDDLVILADSVRRAREALDRITGRAGVDDMLDALFGRFCLGK
jgi:tRNA modification GTPase